MNTGKLWNIFCQVIDNYGDIGVCWRLSADLASRGHRVRLWVDDPSPLVWMAPHGAPGVEVIPWDAPFDASVMEVGDILVEAFGCAIPDAFIATYANWTEQHNLPAIWINLEYLSAEQYVERCHGLPSPVMHGPGAGITKHFYYPGFSPATGGLLREPDLPQRLAQFDRAAWLRAQGITNQSERLVSLFCYEPGTLHQLLHHLASDHEPTRLLVTAGRASEAVKTCINELEKLNPHWNQRKSLSLWFLPSLTQRDFDHLLWACDLNFVRGEDSLLRAIWADKPFIWQIYPQHDDAHHDKLDALLATLNTDPSWRDFHEVWNGLKQGNLQAPDPATWQNTVTRARDLLIQQDDLVSQLLKFVAKNH